MDLCLRNFVTLVIGLGNLVLGILNKILRVVDFVESSLPDIKCNQRLHRTKEFFENGLLDVLLSLSVDTVI